jgi:hypothetical protein
MGNQCVGPRMDCVDSPEDYLSDETNSSGISVPLTLPENDEQDYDAAFSYCDSAGDCFDAAVDLPWLGSENELEMVNPFDSSEGWSFHHKTEGGIDIFTRSVEKGLEFGSCDETGQCRKILISREHDTDDERKIDGYLFHKIGKNIGFRTMFAAAFAPRTVLMYRNYKSQYPNRGFFKGDPTSRIFDHNSKVGRAFEKLAPQQFRKNNLSDSERAKLRSSGAAMGKFSSNMMKNSNRLRLGGNGLSLAIMGAQCLDGECEESRIVSVTMDTASTSVFYGVQHYMGDGHGAVAQTRQLLSAAEDAGQVADKAVIDQLEKSAYAKFRIGNILAVGGYSFQLGSGIVKIYGEIQNIKADAQELDMSKHRYDSSNVVDGSIDIAQSMGDGGYKAWVVYQGKALLKLGELKKATDALSVRSIKIPTVPLWSLRFLGMAGAGYGLYRNVQDLKNIDSATNLTDAERSKRENSIYMSMAANAVFIGASFFIAPAAITVGTALTCVALGIVAVNAVYSNWDDLVLLAGDAGDWISDKVPEFIKDAGEAVFEVESARIEAVKYSPKLMHPMY